MLYGPESCSIVHRTCNVTLVHRTCSTVRRTCSIVPIDRASRARGSGGGSRRGSGLGGRRRPNISESQNVFKAKIKKLAWWRNNLTVQPTKRTSPYVLRSCVWDFSSNPLSGFVHSVWAVVQERNRMRGCFKALHGRRTRCVNSVCLESNWFVEAAWR